VNQELNSGLINNNLNNINNNIYPNMNNNYQSPYKITKQERESNKLDSCFDDKLSISSLEYLESSISSGYKDNNNFNYGVGLSKSIKKNYFNNKAITNILNSNLVFEFCNKTYMTLYQKLLMILFFDSSFVNSFELIKSKKEKLLEHNSKSIEHIIVTKLLKILIKTKKESESQRSQIKLSKENNRNYSLRILLIFYLFFERFSEDILFEHLILLKLNSNSDRVSIYYNRDDNINTSKESYDSYDLDKLSNEIIFLNNIKVKDGEYQLNSEEILTISQIYSNFEINSSKSNKILINEIILKYVKERPLIKEISNIIKAQDYLIIYYLFYIQNILLTSFPIDDLVLFLNSIITYYKTNKIIDEKLNLLLKICSRSNSGSDLNELNDVKTTQAVKDKKIDKQNIFSFIKANKNISKELLLEQLKNNFEFTSDYKLLINNSKLIN